MRVVGQQLGQIGNSKPARNPVLNKVTAMCDTSLNPSTQKTEAGRFLYIVKGQT